MATPARTTAAVPTTSVLSRKKGPSPGVPLGVGVKVEAPAPTVVVLPPPCSSFTPVKSPEPKKAKPSQHGGDDDDRGCIKRSLCGQLDEAGAVQATSTPVPTEVDSSLGSQTNAATRLNVFQLHPTYMGYTDIQNKMPSDLSLI